MSQLFEKKCDCKYYDGLNEHGAALLKMELPEYETPDNGSSYVICRVLRFMGYITVAVLLSYSLWRIHVIESTLAASDRLHNLTRTIALESSRLNHNRVTRSVPVGHHADVNSLGTDKDLPRGSMLTAKNEFVPAKRRRPTDEREFEYLVHSLLEKIQTMHNDTDRAHLGSNMKALFQAWFPVFDALLPEELVEDPMDPLASITGSVKERLERSVNEEDKGIKSDWQKLERNFPSMDRMNFIFMNMREPPTETDDEQGKSNEESINAKSSETKEKEQSSDDNEQEMFDALTEIEKFGKKRAKGRIHRLVRSIADKTSEESSEEKKQTITETAADKTSEESSEEKKPRTTRSAADKTSEESSEEKKPRPTRSAADKTSEESSEEKKQRLVRSVSMGSDESASSSEEEKRRVKYNKNNKSKESSEEEEKKEDKSKTKEKSSEESIESSESTESKEKKNTEKNELFYQVVSSDQDGSKTIVQVD